ncbi:MAG: hypothetical protein QM820_22775 [Minicystis sp.]
MFSDQAVAGSPSVMAASFFSTALDAAVARSARASLFGASPVARPAASFVAAARSAAERFCTDVARFSSIVAGSTSFAPTSVGRPHSVTSARYSPTRTRIPSAVFSSTTAVLRSSPCSPRGTPVQPLHRMAGSPPFPASGAASSIRHAAPGVSDGSSTCASARPPASTTVVALARPSSARTSSGSGRSAPPSGVQPSAEAHTRARTALPSARIARACCPRPAGTVSVSPFDCAAAGVARARAARAGKARWSRRMGR